MLLVGNSQEARQTARDPASDDMAILELVMQEIAHIMGARGVTLTLHDGGTYPVVILYRDPNIAGADYDRLLAMCHAGGGELADGRLSWRRAANSDQEAAILPVERVPGHSRLLITVVFDAPDAAARQRAEQVYRERQPFAIGFFRFWQLNRLHLRRYQTLETALDCTAIGVILIDRAGHILFANQAAEQILAAGDGLSKHNETLRATHLNDGVNLSAALSYISFSDQASEAREPTRAPLLAFRRRGGPSLMATIVPTQVRAIEARDVAATIYLVDPKLDMAKNLGPICQLYGLSPVETELVCQLAAGEPLADAAARMRIKEQTARGYLKHIFIKTGTNRQTALVALMLSSLMRMKSDVLQEALTDSAAARALARYE